MQLVYSPILSQQTSLQKLPLPSLDHKKHLPSKITDHVIEINQELINLEKDYYTSSKTNQKLNPIKRKKTLPKSTQILFPIVFRLHSCRINPQRRTTIVKNTYKRYNTTTSLPNPINSFKRNTLVNELKSIDEDSSYFQKHLITDMKSYADQENQMNRQFNKLKTLKDKLIYRSNEYLQPEFTNPFIQINSNDFYSSLDKIIDKVNNNASIDLFKTMKLVNEDKEKRNSKLVFTNEKIHDKLDQLLHEGNKISKRISKL